VHIRLMHHQLTPVEDVPAMADEPAATHSLVMKVTSPWAKYGDTNKVWSTRWCLSGSNLTEASEIQALVQALWAIIGQFGNIVTQAPFQSYLSEALYYHSGSTINFWNAAYTPSGESWCEISDAGWNSPTSGSDQQLEVCALLTARMGTNSKGRAYYLRKFMHCVPAANGGTTICGVNTAGETALATLSSGFGANDYVIVDPKNGDAPITGWSFRNALYTRQLRKSPKSSKA
jgi:hypothetical protein